MLPTFCELAGAELPIDYITDGLSQVETLRGRGKAIRTKPLFWKISASWPPRETKPDHWASFAVLDQRWKLCANHDLKYTELFDLINDPLETMDLAESNPKVVEHLLGLLDVWLASLPEKPTGPVFSSLREN